MGVKIRKNRGKLYLDIYQNGNRRWEALHLTLTKDREQNKEIMRLAELCRSQRETQLLAGEWNIQDPVAGKKRLVTYLAECSKHYARPGIVGNCIYHVKKFRNGETVLISQIDSRWVEGFQEYLLREAGVCQNSASNYERTLRTVLRKAVAEHIITYDPAGSVPRIEAVETELIFLSAEELQQLADVKPVDYAGVEVRRAFLFACQTGLRISDLETLTWGQIERSPLQIIKRQKKTKNPVYIPLNETAAKLIMDGKPQGNADLVFKFLYKRDVLYKHLERWGTSAGMTKKLTWHTARRTFATLALESGVDIYTVSKLLGHKSIEQVAKYAKATDRLKRAAVAALPSIKI